MLDRDISNSGEARTKLNFIKPNGEIVCSSWNNIQHFTFKFQDGYKYILQERKEERQVSKEEAIEIIYKMQSLKDSPIDSLDFRKKQENGLGIKTILRIWGTVGAMQDELCLVNTGLRENKLSQEEYKRELKYICDNVYQKENRKTILYTDINKYGSCNVSTYRRYCELDGTTLNDIFNTYGFVLQRAGSGMNHEFDDGEKTTSKYEFYFSKFLRENGFEYNKNYFRNVRYKTIDEDYKGNMNCDYKIIMTNKIVYIELAGILGNREHQEAFKNNFSIKSKTKEKYRLGLMEKINIFERNNLDYYILLKDDIESEKYKTIFDDTLQKVG